MNNNIYNNQNNLYAQNPYMPYNQYDIFARYSDYNNTYNTPFARATVPYIKDYGDAPLTLNIEEITKRNNTFRTALWTGKHLQVTLMSINVGESIGLEMHPDTDQFIRIEQGVGLVQMGDSKDNLNYQETVYDEFAFVIPAGKWHNLTNIGNVPIKLYSIYAPPHHPKGTVHKTKMDAEH